MEDVAIVRRLGRRRISTLRTAAVTSASRYKRQGYTGRIARNWACLTLYSLGASPAWLKRVYG